MKNIIILFLLTGCTINIFQTDTHGSASDVVDETSTISPDIKPEISVPLSPI